MKVYITDKELQESYCGESWMRMTLKEKGLPMIGNFFPEFDFDNYWYQSYYEPENMRSVYEAHRAEILEDDEKEGNQHLEDQKKSD